ncbi:hypothetical protein [Nocardia aurantiaca]|uniref:Uncharacterized protein n=1 Tax=Nocardia aurantiaca TaxID=2675850 RepID=A0A6I3L239_9NOCA|nr:hypothetical protein [Nocardia aurantiaca]MTE17073.1 hypothetical protein [Nocardia aurantiaca]
MTAGVPASDRRIVIVGAGLSGVGMVVSLRREGIADGFDRVTSAQRSPCGPTKA